jgi:hypothetical protein
MMALIEANRGQREVPSPPSEAHKTLELMLAVLQSNDAGGAPVSAPFGDR